MLPPRQLPAATIDPARLSALERYEILDTAPEGGFDDLAHLAAQFCATPVALVSLVAAERQWFKARSGFETAETPIAQSVCAHAILQGGLLVIPDLTQDARTRGNPLVTGDPRFRFYAGAVLETPAGHPLGTLCVLDYEPRPEGLTLVQASALQALARQVMSQLELRRTMRAEATVRQNLEASRSRYQAVFDSAVDYAIVVTDRDGLIQDWNEGATRILGWTFAEIRGHDLGFFFTPEDRDAGIPQQEMDNARAAGRGIDERWHLRRNGERFWASGEMMPLRGADGHLDGYVKVLRDRTPQRLVEERLRLADERLQMALGASGAVGLWDWMADTDLLHGDATFARLYGVDVAEAAGGLAMEQYQVFVVGEDLAPLRARIQEVFEHGADFFIDYRLAIPGQPLRWVECKGRLIHGPDGTPSRFSGTAIDITERKNAEAQIRLLMQELSHRVKNTFAVVQAIVSQTLRGTDPALVTTLSDRLMALSRAHDVLLQSDWASTTLHALLSDVLRMEAEGGRFVLFGPDLTIGARAALSLSLLLHEMATNAVKYGALSVERGRVDVGWSLEEGTFRLSWREIGGPPARPPERRGFGSRLIGMGICSAREAKLDYGPDGLRAVFSAPASVLAEETA